MAIPSVKWRSGTCINGIVVGAVSIALFHIFSFCNGQHFDGVVEDNAYLDNIERDIKWEVNRTREAFYSQAQLLDGVARQFVAAQLKENLFIALRVLAEKELNEMKESEGDGEETEGNSTTPATVITTDRVSSNRTKRQDDGDEDGDDGDGGGAAGAAAGAAGAIPNRPTIPPQIGLLPQVANLVRVFFGGNGNTGVNLTSYVASASKLLPRPVGNQVLGLVKILTNANANRNSFTTPNPLNGGAAGLPADFNLKSPALAGLSQEQVVALALAQSGQFNGISPELLQSVLQQAHGSAGGGPNGLGGLPGINPLAGQAGLPGLGGIGGAGSPNNGGIGPLGAAGAGGINSNLAGLSNNDLAYLAALGITDLNQLLQTPAPETPPTRKPRPHYPSQSHQNNHHSNNNNLFNNPQPQLESSNNLNFQQLLHPQATSTSLPTLEEPFLSFQQPTQPTPSFNNPLIPNNNGGAPSISSTGYNPNPQFVAAEKDILPLNLNPNKQTISQIQEHLHALNTPKFQETPQSPSHPAVHSPTNNIQLPIESALHQQQQQQLTQNLNPQLTQSLLQSNPAYGQQLQQLINLQQQQLNQQQEQLNQFNQNHQNVGGPVGPLELENLPGNDLTIKTPGEAKPNKNKRPLNPVLQQQAQAQAEQLQQLQQLQQQETHKVKPLGGDNSQNQQAPQLTFTPQQVALLHQQLLQQQQANLLLQQQQQKQNQQGTSSSSSSNKPPGLSGGVAGLQQQINANQANINRYQQLLLQQQNQRRPGERPPGNDEDESEEEDNDTEGFDTRARTRGNGRQLPLDIIRNIFPSILGGNRNTNNNNNNNNNNFNNNYNQNQNNNNNYYNQQQLQQQQQQQQPPNNNINQQIPGNQGNGTYIPPNNNINNGNNNGNNNNGNNNNGNNNNNNNNFDLQEFARNLSRGIGDVVRVMPDLFRGAREGLQLIQALSSILQAFPGLADALPIP